MVVIDLDSPAPPAEERRRSPWPWRRVRPFLAAAVLIVTAAVLSGAQSPGAVQPLVFHISGYPLFAGGDTLYTQSTDNTVLRAYSLRTGRERWHTSLPPAPKWLPRLSGDLLMLSRNQPRQTVAIDARTGALRWTGDGTPVWVRGDRVVLAASDASGLAGLTVLSAGTGRPIDRVDLASAADTQFAMRITDRPDDDMEGVVRGHGPDARLLDFTTWRERPMPGVPAPAGERLRSRVLLGPGVTVVSTDGADSRARLVGYDPATFRQLWSVPDERAFGGLPCGPAICLWDIQGSAAYDPATGGRRWRSDWAQLLPGPAGQVLGVGFGAHGLHGLAVLDAATGREQARFDDWTPYPQPVTDRPGAPIPMTRRGPSGFAVATLDPARGTLSQIGVVRQDMIGCWASARDIGCQLTSSTVLAWRYAD